MRDGLVAQVDLPDVSEELRLLTLRSALLRREGRPEVFVIERNGPRSIARARTLRTGRSAGEWIEILDGLEAGDEVVYDGHFALEDGSVVDVEGLSMRPAQTASRSGETE
jgi:multidrug efflux pump subunit AcrA (membrane-fusion protein)